jgi:hypothetical protein
MALNMTTLTSHGANLRKFSSLNLAQQLCRSGGIQLKEHLKHVQGAVPMVLMPPIVQKLELGDVERQVDLGNAPIGAHHLAQPRPGTLDGVAMDLTLAISVQVQGILTATVIDRLVPISLTRKEVIDAVAVGIDVGAPLDHLLHNGTNVSV